MAATVEYKQDEMNSGDSKEKEKEKEKEQEKGDHLSLFGDFDGATLNLELLHKSNQFQEALDSESESPLLPDAISIMHSQDPGADDLLTSENNTTDYDWLLSPPRNPLPSPESEEQKTLASYDPVSDGQSTSPQSRVENPPADSTSTTNIAPRLPASSNGVKSSGGTIRRPSPSRKAPSTGSRSATPTKQASAPSTAKSSRSSTPTSRATVAAMKPVAPSKRSTTPTRPSGRSSTPTPRTFMPVPAKSTSRSSTPTLRPSIIAASKSTSRSSTPTQRPSNPSGLLITSVNGGRSSSVTKARTPISNNQASSRGSSPSVRSRPSNNQPERPVSASRGRPGVPTVKLPATETNSKAIPKRTSCSPSRGQVSNGSANNGVKSGLTRSRGYSNGNDDVNPVLMGTKMVERVVNMRKLAPPRQDYPSNPSNASGKLSVSQDNSGFGRTLSKKSFDMALRHLDIRRSMPGNMRAMITKVPASSVYSVRSESTKTQTISGSDSPLATSSSAGSDLANDR